VTAVAAVLLVPSQDHREALIGDGPCGSRAPVAWFTATHRWRAGVADRYAGTEGQALVLAWDGKPVADGLARLARFFPIVSRASIFPETMASVIALARRAEAPLGRVVLLDAAVPEHT
jgi:hypothetical protein